MAVTGLGQLLPVYRSYSGPADEYYGFCLGDYEAYANNAITPSQIFGKNVLLPREAEAMVKRMSDRLEGTMKTYADIKAKEGAGKIALRDFTFYNEREEAVFNAQNPKNYLKPRFIRALRRRLR